MGLFHLETGLASNKGLHKHGTTKSYAPVRPCHFSPGSHGVGGLLSCLGGGGIVRVLAGLMGLPGVGLVV